MAHVVQPLDQPSNYRDSQARVDRQSQHDLLSRSTTLYIGNLSFYTTEEQIYELFNKCASIDDGGGVKRIIMGLDRNTKTPCGFCFVEFYTTGEARAALRYVTGTKLDERVVRCDLDLGYRDGRQFGRGRSGGQVRDEHRADYDAGRGGWGAQAARQEAERRRAVEERYADAGQGPVAGGGGDWKDAGVPAAASRKRARDEDEDELGRQTRPKAEDEERKPDA